MTEQQRKDPCGQFWSVAVIVAFFALVAIQQSWVKHRPIGIAPQPAQSSLVFPSPVTNSFASHIGHLNQIEAAFGVKSGLRAPSEDSCQPTGRSRFLDPPKFFHHMFPPLADPFKRRFGLVVARFRMVPSEHPVSVSLTFWMSSSCH